MFPKWFSKWNSDNPTNVFGPAILVGVAGSAVFVASMLVAFGQPFATDSLQTGPRGTGMSVPEFEADLAKPDPDIATYVGADDITDEDIAAVSTAALSNVPPTLEGISRQRYAQLVAAMRTWTGIPDLMEDPDNYQTKVAYSMVEMVQNLNENWGGHVNANKEVGVTCMTCHRGQAVPSDIWFKLGDVNQNMAGWSAIQNRATPLSQFTSLPSDALEKYLLDGEVIGVHDLESRVAGVPGVDGYPGIQQAERTYSLMNYVSNALGVNCVFCHNSRAFYDGAQVTPQWGTEILGIQMVLELNNDYLVPLKDEYPPERLGPVHADAPKAACKTCHKGYQQPLQGLNVIGDWPELATTEFSASAN